MARIDKTVFISYRRTNVPWALAISQSLTHSGYDVFFDFTGLASGDFEGVILDNIHARAHFLILLTPSALERCGEPGDWLRREIEAAFDSKRNIVPLMLEGFDFGTPSISNQLTGKLAALKKYNAMTVSAEYFDAAMEKLRRFLNVALETVVQPASPAASQAATDEKSAVASAPAVAGEELTAQQWFERGVDAYNHRSFDEALRFFSSTIRFIPGYADAYYNRGLARIQKGDLEGAIADYNEAIRLKPDDSWTFNNRGMARRAKGDLIGALEDYDQAIRLNSVNAQAFNNRGNVRSDMDELEGALQDYDQAIRLRPDYPLAFSNRGDVFYRRGNVDEALNDYNWAISLKPDFALAYCNRGVARQAKGDLDGAIHDCNEAIRLRADFAEAFDSRGNVLRAQGNLKAALRDYEEALRLKPRLVSAIKNRDDVLKAIADRSKS
jgi:tetratricopeptide (TPR) repeat protein